jgi:hypothetical protein
VLLNDLVTSFRFEFRSPGLTQVALLFFAFKETNRFASLLFAV